MNATNIWYSTPYTCAHRAIQIVPDRFSLWHSGQVKFDTITQRLRPLCEGLDASYIDPVPVAWLEFQRHEDRSGLLFHEDSRMLLYIILFGIYCIWSVYFKHSFAYPVPMPMFHRETLSRIMCSSGKQWHCISWLFAVHVLFLIFSAGSLGGLYPLT